MSQVAAASHLQLRLTCGNAVPMLLEKAGVLVFAVCSKWLEHSQNPAWVMDSMFCGPDALKKKKKKNQESDFLAALCNRLWSRPGREVLTCFMLFDFHLSRLCSQTVGQGQSFCSWFSTARLLSRSRLVWWTTLPCGFLGTTSKRTPPVMTLSVGWWISFQGTTNGWSSFYSSIQSVKGKKEP